ncbi:hypothetical protein FIC_01081 [Flavobacteriaceae bacterium 3519-10]|nr:hypothetical protein FIC_01081 [Flavobacteriaceae bacterium 3519-10]
MVIMLNRTAINLAFASQTGTYNTIMVNMAPGDNADSLCVSTLQLFLHDMLKELYFAQVAIDTSFTSTEGQVSSPKLETILKNHSLINLNHEKRLTTIFNLLDIPVEYKDSVHVTALLVETENHLNMCAKDRITWEITLIISARKVARYKMTAYEVASHLAIILGHTQVATLLAVSAQEEEEFILRFLDGLTHEFSAPKT